MNHPPKQQTICLPIEATNMSMEVELHRRKGVRITCDQELEEHGDGPQITVMPYGDNWEIVIRPCTNADAGRVRILVSKCKGKRDVPIVSVHGVRVHFNDLFDTEDDRWEGGGS